MADFLETDGVRRSSPALQLRMMMLTIESTANFLAGTYRTDVEVPARAEIIDGLAHFIYNGARER